MSQTNNQGVVVNKSKYVVPENPRYHYDLFEVATSGENELIRHIAEFSNEGLAILVAEAMALYVRVGVANGQLLKGSDENKYIVRTRPSKAHKIHGRSPKDFSDLVKGEFDWEEPKEYSQVPEEKAPERQYTWEVFEDKYGITPLQKKKFSKKKC